MSMLRCGMVLALLALTVVSTCAADRPVAPNGIALPDGYRGWQAVAPSYRPDKDHIRMILGNDTAVRALQEGTRPFPDGTMLAKIAWTTRKHPQFPVAVEPDKFVQVEFMIKDAAKYRETGGWGFARFITKDLKPYGKDASFVMECFGCHTPVKDNDYVFTSWPKVPGLR